MPGRDGTGPMGMGPMTGRGFRSGGAAFAGRGYGNCRDFRPAGWCRWYQGFDPNIEQRILEDQVQLLETNLNQAKQRLHQLGTTEKK